MPNRYALPMTPSPNQIHITNQNTTHLCSPVFTSQAH